jgi:hypothetical protein
LVPQNLNFLSILHKQDKAQAPPPPAGHKQIDAPQEKKICSRLAGYKNIKLGQISSAFPSSTAK